MPKHKPEVTMASYGIYTKWHESTKELPKILEFTTRVPARIDIEFGFIVKIKRAKNQKITFEIDHPKIPDENGKPMAPFTGEVYVKNNDWDFFLGDTIWAPVENKLGEWKLSISMNGKRIAHKTFTLFDEKATSSTP